MSCIYKQPNRRETNGPEECARDIIPSTISLATLCAEIDETQERVFIDDRVLYLPLAQCTLNKFLDRYMSVWLTTAEDD